MKVFFYLILAILVFLALSSGLTKVMLVPQKVEFFSQYGFTNPVLIAFGVLQILGALMLVFSKLRLIGATILAVTFLFSAAVLASSGNLPVTLITFACVGLLGFIAKYNSKFNGKVI